MYMYSNFYSPIDGDINTLWLGSQCNNYLQDIFVYQPDRSSHGCWYFSFIRMFYHSLILTDTYWYLYIRIGIHIPVCGFGFLFLYDYVIDFKTYLFKMKDFPGMRETVKELELYQKNQKDNKTVHQKQVWYNCIIKYSITITLFTLYVAFALMIFSLQVYLVCYISL